MILRVTNNRQKGILLAGRVPFFLLLLGEHQTVEKARCRCEEERQEEGCCEACSLTTLADCVGGDGRAYAENGEGGEERIDDCHIILFLGD